MYVKGAPCPPWEKLKLEKGEEEGAKEGGDKELYTANSKLWFVKKALITKKSVAQIVRHKLCHFR